MTVRKTDTFGFDGGKEAAHAASGVVAPHREFHPPAPEGEWMSGCGSIRPSGWRRALADVVEALPALRDPAALAVQGEALQQVSMQGVQARAAGAARQDFVKPSNKPETNRGRFGRQGQNRGEGTRQHRAPASSKEKPAGAAGGTLNAAPAGNTAAILAAATRSGLPGQGGAEKGEERPARRRVWPVAPGVPASSREAARARRGEGAALVIGARRIGEGVVSDRCDQLLSKNLEAFRGKTRSGLQDDQRASIRPDLGLELFQLGRRQGSDPKQRRHLIENIIRLKAALGRVFAQAARSLETDGPGAIIAFCKRAPRRHGYGASEWMTRTSCRSLRRSATEHSPREIRSMAIACSAGTRSRPFSQSLMWPRELRPRSRARSSWDQFRVFRSRTSFIERRVRIIRRLSQLDSFGLSGPTR